MSGKRHRFFFIVEGKRLFFVDVEQLINGVWRHALQPPIISILMPDCFLPISIGIFPQNVRLLDHNLLSPDEFDCCFCATISFDFNGLSVLVLARVFLDFIGNHRKA